MTKTLKRITVAEVETLQKLSIETFSDTFKDQNSGVVMLGTKHRVELGSFFSYKKGLIFFVVKLSTAFDQTVGD